MKFFSRRIDKIFLTIAIITIFSFASSATLFAFSKPKGKCKINNIGVSRIIKLSDIKTMNFGGKYEKLPLKPFEVVLTFDDGPTPEVTNEILKTLENECTKATFFMLGERIKENPIIAKSIVQKGHSIGLHSLSHLSMRSLSDEDQIIDFSKTQEIAKIKLNNYSPILYRFPFLQDTQSLTKYLNDNGIKVISVDALGYDWETNASIKAVQNNIFTQLEMNKNSGIILLHDNQKMAALTLPELLKSLKAKGYHVVALVP